MISNVVW